MLAAGSASASKLQSTPTSASTPSAEEIKQQDITVLPTGAGLPDGSGTPDQGEAIYKEKCAGCHGENGEGKPPTGVTLVGGIGTLATAKPVKTIGSYWPYATSVWDYIHRSMPYTEPGTLTADETYALTAFLLFKNGIIRARPSHEHRNTCPKFACRIATVSSPILAPMSAKAPLPRASRNSAKKDSSRLPPGEKFGNERGERFNPGKTVEPSICRRASFPSARWPTFLWRVMQAIRTTFCPAASGQKLPRRILRLRKWIPDIEILVDSERVGSRLGARQHIFLEPLRPGIEPTRIFPA